jgi:hypothetical protein
MGNGVHVVKATAYDAAGNGSTAQASVTVGDSGGADTTPPSVSLTSPADGATVSGTIGLQVVADDNAGVVSVTFSANGQVVGTDTTAPYGITWNTSALPDGSVTLTATAVDAAGNSAADTVTVTVQNASSAPAMHVGDIAMTAQSKGPNVEAFARVLIVDEAGLPVAGALVTGVWSGPATGQQTVQTNGEGVALFRSAKVRGGGTFTFTVSRVEHASYSYDASANVETSDSITR